MIEETYALSPPVDPEVERRVAELMARPYRKAITGDANEGYLASVPDLPGCMTAGETEAEALELLQDAMRGWLESSIERGLPIPEPGAASTYSGKLLVRMPKSLHRRLIERADDEGVSANQLAVTLLSGVLETVPEPALASSALRPEQSYSIDEAAAALRTDGYAVRKLINFGFLSAVPVGQSVRVLRSSVSKFDQSFKEHAARTAEWINSQREQLGVSRDVLLEALAGRIDERRLATLERGDDRPDVIEVCWLVSALVEVGNLPMNRDPSMREALASRAGYSIDDGKPVDPTGRYHPAVV